MRVSIQKRCCKDFPVNGKYSIPTYTQSMLGMPKIFYIKRSCLIVLSLLVCMLHVPFMYDAPIRFPFNTCMCIKCKCICMYMSSGFLRMPNSIRNRAPFAVLQSLKQCDNIEFSPVCAKQLSSKHRVNSIRHRGKIVNSQLKGIFRTKVNKILQFLVE